MRKAKLLTFLAVTLCAAVSVAAPPDPSPAPSPRIIPRIDPKILLGPRIVGARDARGPAGTPGYEVGMLPIQIEVFNPSSAAVTATVLVGPNGSLARTSVNVAPNARAWVLFRDEEGIVNGCRPKEIPIALENGPASTLVIAPSCTFTPEVVDPDRGTSADTLARNRRGKLYCQSVRLRAPACAEDLEVSAVLTNDGSVPATNVNLVLDGRRSDPSVTLPARASVTRTPHVGFTGRHGHYPVTVEGTGVPLYERSWRIYMNRSCTVAVSVRAP